MQGFAERKKEEKELVSGEKKKPKPHFSLSMSEGPMILADSGSVEAHGRASFEKSVKVELAAMKERKAGKKRRGKRRGKKRARR